MLGNESPELVKVLQLILKEQMRKNELLGESIDLQRESMIHQYEHSTSMLKALIPLAEGKVQIGWIEILAMEPGQNQAYRTMGLDGKRGEVTYSLSTCVQFFDTMAGRPVFLQKVGETYRVLTEEKIVTAEDKSGLRSVPSEES